MVIEFRVSAQEDLRLMIVLPLEHDSAVLHAVCNIKVWIGGGRKHQFP